MNERAFACLAERLPRPDDMKPDAYQRNIAARAFDVARYLLFWGVPTNVGQVTSIRTLEKQIRRLKASEYAELRDLGDEIAQRLRAPTRTASGMRTPPPSRWRRRWRATPIPMSTPRARARRSAALGGAESAAAARASSRAASTCCGPRNVPADIVATLLYPVTDRPFRELYEMACGWSDRAARRSDRCGAAVAHAPRRDPAAASAAASTPTIS